MPGVIPDTCRTPRSGLRGLAGYTTTAAGRRVAFALYVNNLEVGPESDAVQAVAGQALGEMAAAVYEAAR